MNLSLEFVAKRGNLSFLSMASVLLCHLHRYHDSLEEDDQCWTYTKPNHHVLFVMTQTLDDGPNAVFLQQSATFPPEHPTKLRLWCLRVPDDQDSFHHVFKNHRSVFSIWAGDT